MSASGTGAGVLSFVLGLAGWTFATTTAMRRKDGRVARRGAVIGYRLRTLVLALGGLGCTLNGVAVILMEADDRDPAFWVAMSALGFLFAGGAVKTLAEVAVRRRA